MEKRVRCPFNGKPCVECAIYRGRHCSLGLAKRTATTAGRNGNRASASVSAADFSPFDAMRTPRAALPAGGELPVALRVTDVEEGTTRLCGLEEPQHWDWANPNLLRLVDGWQVPNFARLLDILQYKAENGCREVELKEVPRFMLLAGG